MSFQGKKRYTAKTKQSQYFQVFFAWKLFLVTFIMTQSDAALFTKPPLFEKAQ